MATLYLKAAGGNWTDAAAWSSTGSGGVDNAGPPTSADDCIAEAGSGNLTISATSVGKSFSATAGTGNWAGTLTHNGFSWTLSGSLTFSSEMTFTPNANSTFTITSAATITSAGKTFRSITVSAAITLGDNLSFDANAKNYSFILAAASSLNMNGFTVSGNSTTNRVLICSNNMGVSRTITLNGGTFANADFRDIQFSNATDLDLSAITGLSGDCGGNTITGGGTVLTFTSPTTQTYTGGAGNWSTVGSWTSRVPLPQDNVSMSGCTGGSIVADMPRLGKDIDWTGATGTPTWTINSIATEVYGSVTLISGMTLTHTSVTFVLAGRGNHTITSAGKTWASSSSGAFSIQAFGGTYTLQDAFIKGAATGALALTNGTFDMNGFNVTVAGSVGFGSTSSAARTLYMRSGTFTVSGSSGSPWNVVSSLTLDAGTSTILLTDTGASSKTFVTGGKTYYNLLISGGGAGAVIINTGGATFNRIYTDGAGTKSITLPGSATTTLLSGQGLANGTNVITFTASAGSATVSKASGTLSWDYVNLTNIPSTGGAAFYAGTHSTDGGGNTGWIFTAPPATGTRTNLGRVAPNSISIGIGI